MIRKVEFQSEGATLRGRMYLPPESQTPRPSIVMTHGTSATITMTTDRYAEVFCDAGFIVLLYDHRNFGISDGEPRQEINPWIQARGYRDALTFLEQVPEVDRHRLALWGDSYSGGEAMVVAATDSRVKALVVQCPVCGLASPPPDPTGDQFNSIRDILFNGDVRGTPDTTAGPMPVVSFDQVRHPSLLQPVSAYRWFMEHGGRHGSGWQNDVSRVIPHTPAPFSPVLCAPHIAIPTLMMVAPEDEMVHANPSVSRHAFELLAGPKKVWHEIAGGHFGLLWYPSELFDEAARVQRDFLVQSLG